MSQSDSEETCLVDETDVMVNVKSSLCCFKKQEFSVQSGDVRRTTPQDETDVQDINTLSLKEKLLHKIHQTIYKGVNIFFANFLPPVVTLLFALVLIPVGLGLLTIFVYPPQLDLSLRSFQIPNHESSMNYDAFQMALHPHVAIKDDDNSGNLHKRDCTEPQSLLTSWALNIFYVSRDNKNILTEARIKQIHKIEKDILKHKYNGLGYQDLCHKSKPYEICDPLNSFLTFFYPSYNGSQWIYDGNGDVMQPINSTLAMAFQIDSSYWYGEFKSNKFESRLLRSQLRVGAPILHYCRASENIDTIHNIMTDYFLSFIPYLDSASTE